MRACPLLPIVLTIMCSMVQAADLHVDLNNETGVEDGSASRPYTSLSAAVAAAASGDRVFVAQGTYPGPIIVREKTLELFGGYEGGPAAGYIAGSSGDFSEAGREVHSTTLQGDPTNAVLLLVDTGTSVVEGFTIRGGGGAREDAFRTQGGGVYVRGGSPTIARNLIEDNNGRNPAMESFGGGIYTGDSDCRIIGNMIRNNRSERGGGIAVGGGSVIIRDNTIEGNVGEGDHGGGIYAFSPDILIEGNLIKGNEIGRSLGYGWGGGLILFNPGASGTIRGNVIHHNYSPGAGSGVFIDEGATAIMENCLVYANETNPDAGAGAVYVDPGPDDIGSRITIRHCTIAGHRTPEPTLGGNALFVSPYCSAIVENSILWDNDGSSVFADPLGTVAVSWSTTEDEVAGTGNVQSDPLFADDGAGDYHLRSAAGRWSPGTRTWILDEATSPAIDGGNPDSPFLLEPLGNGSRANQGAYGNTPEASRTTLPPGGNGFLTN